MPGGLIDILERGEGIEQDFKHTVSSSRKIAITLSAFANTQGGALFIGVRYNGTVKGCSPEEERHMLQGAADLYCHPSPILDFKIWKTTAGQVLECRVHPLKNRPCYAKIEGSPIAYLRIDDENIAASPVSLRLWKRQGEHLPLIYKGSLAKESLLRLVRSEEEFCLEDAAQHSGLNLDETTDLLSELMYLHVIDEIWDGEKYVYKARE